MKENIKLITKIIAKTAFKWGFILVLGSVITVIAFLIAGFTNYDFITDVGFFALFKENIFSFILIISFPFFIFIYFNLANKTSIQYALHLIWEGKASSYISSKLEKLIVRLTEKEGWRKKVSDKVVLRGRLLQLSKEDDDTSKLQRKIISYILKKITLDDIDFKDPNLNLAGILTKKFEDFISGIVEPSMMMFWIFALVQIVLLIISLII